MMFMEEHLHSTTVTAAMRILVVLLSNQSILIKFKEGLSGGGWLDQTDSVLTNKIGTVLGRHLSPLGLRVCWELCWGVELWVMWGCCLNTSVTHLCCHQMLLHFIFLTSQSWDFLGKREWFYKAALSWHDTDVIVVSFGSSAQSR